MTLTKTAALDQTDDRGSSAAGALIPFPRAMAAPDTLIVAGELSGAWSALDESMREAVASFFGPLTRMRWRVVDASLPDRISNDLATGGRTFLEAFTRIERRVIAIRRSRRRVCVRVECEGEHRGPFFDILSATGRRVRFDAVHELVLGKDGRVADTVRIDVRAIVRQLARPAPSRV